MSTTLCTEPHCEEAAGVFELVIDSRVRDIGEIDVRRLLPASRRQRVGPFIFFDHAGPAEFPPGGGMAVLPHPHIGLATVTFIFEGEVHHRDSLGSSQVIRRGAVNWMTAGRGIVHSERTPTALRESGSRLHLLQVWVALPIGSEECEPSFVHHPEGTIPRYQAPGLLLSIVAGRAFGLESPVRTASETLFVAGEIEKGAELEAPAAYEERAVYVVDGEVLVGGSPLRPGQMGVLSPGTTPAVRAETDARLAIVGGAPLAGKRHIWWNFVASSSERLEKAKDDWKNERFDAVPGDPERTPLPED